LGTKVCLYRVMFIRAFILGLLLQMCTTISAQQDGPAILSVTFQEKPIKLNQAYYLPSLGDSIRISKLKFYLGYGQDDKSYQLCDIEETNSTELNSFKTEDGYMPLSIGVDSLTNVAGVQGGDLDPMHGMYWTWNSGYINFKLEGTSPACNSRKNKFQLHLGGFIAPYNSVRQIKLSVKEKSDTINIKLKLDKFLHQINLEENHTIMSPSQKTMDLMDKLSQAFSIE